MVLLLGLSAGIFSVAWWPQLPSQAAFLLGMTAVCGALALLRLRSSKSLVKTAIAVFIGFGIGSCWGLISAYQLLHKQLPQSMDGGDFIVSGTVVGLVDSNSLRSRFTFAVQTAETATGQPVQLSKLLLSWYGPVEGAKALQPGDQWRFTLRLRRPRGLQNPGGFDYRNWLLRQGYSATGTVRPTGSYAGQRIAYNNLSHRVGGAIGAWRSSIRQTMQPGQLSNAGVLTALTVGDKQGIAPQWDEYARLGIVHLLVISGLHIGLVAGFGAIIGAGLNRLLLAGGRVFKFTLWHRWVRLIGPYLSPLIALWASLAYSLLAGFSLPAQRALIVVSVVMLAKLRFRRIQPVACFCWSLLLIAISQPMATHSAGFWLSFVAVGTLMFWFYPWLASSSRITFFRGVGAQWALMATLLVPGLLFVGKASWLAPMVNMLAVPWVSLVTVPLSLAGCLQWWLAPDGAPWLWMAADYSMDGLWFLLGLIPSSVGIMTSPVALTWPLLFAAILAVAGLLIPAGLFISSGLRLRLLCCAPLLMGVLAPPSKDPLRVTVLDMGQGLGIVIEMPERTLVYDTGPSYSARFNGGAGIIAPYLRSRGIDTVDLLIVSHSDNDHAGGFAGLVGAIKVDALLLGPEVASKLESQGQSIPAYQTCEARQSWKYHSSDAEAYILFDILGPDSHFRAGLYGNNSSCVLLVRWGNSSILLPGDIETAGEWAILRGSQWVSAPDFVPLTLLVAPHHGSNTSSSRAFIDKIQPSHVVFSAGYKHFFGHPHPLVLGRYQQLQSQMWNTADHGALSFVWNRSGQLSIVSSRLGRRVYWWQ